MPTSKDVRKSAEEVVKTSVTLARDLWEDAQITAIRSGITFTGVVSAALKKYLEIVEEEKGKKKGKVREKVTVE